ncbi:Cyclin [Phytophthora megakarya]|uniref:Cyclin n=1 Tax=Phytophthora megakarya TaxID=4795 RepID=A0A225WIG9_9STRA|nr:Cyclin [Phytophthora megakarya]
MERTWSLRATDATRKRKCEPLQDISNAPKNPSQARASTIRGDGVKTKAHVTTLKLSSKTTAATVQATLKRSVAFTSTSKGKKRASSTKKTETTRAKKRKLEDPENQHQKIQTSLLSFQAAKFKEVKTETENHVEVEADIAVKNIEEEKQTETGDGPKETQKNHVEAEADIAVKNIKEEKQTETGDGPKETQSVTVVEPTVVPAPHDEYAPRPYTCTFNHRGSCFDEETYFASVRDIDAPSATISSHQAKLIKELDIYYKKHEMKYLPVPNYIGTVQLDITEKMRTIVVDWLVEVCEEFELESETFHKAVNLIDRCLKKIQILRKQFQLLGCACIMLAAKFEEVNGGLFNVDDYVDISDQTYTAEQMLDMEVQVLNALEYRVASTTCYGFMHRYMEAGCTTAKQRSLVAYLCDFALLFYHMVRFKPSILVASAVYLARLTTGEVEPWVPTLHHVTKYNPSYFKDCVEELHQLHEIESQVVNTQRDKVKAVSEKYLAGKFHSASTIPACSKNQLMDSFDQYTS